MEREIVIASCVTFDQQCKNARPPSNAIKNPSIGRDPPIASGPDTHVDKGLLLNWSGV